MELVQPGDADWVAAARRIGEQQRAELDRHPPEWPVYALAEPPVAGWLAAWEQQDGISVGVELGYGVVGDETWVRVHSQPSGPAVIRSLDWVLASLLAEGGRDYPVAGRLPGNTTEGLPPAPRGWPAQLVIDTTPVAGTAQLVDEYGVWRVVHSGVVITVTGRGMLTAPRLRRVEDLKPYTWQRGEVLARWAATARAQEEPRPLTGPDDTEPLWAHRGLIAMTLDAHARNAERAALGRPVGRLAPDWGQRWEAATRRQEQLRDQDHNAARDAVTAMVHQIGFLYDNATWWGDLGLRRRAINEVIWVTISGEHNVPSAGAQSAWAVNRHEALHEWQSWADSVR